MTLEKRLFTSESVTEGHPDKIADQISDAILDAVLEQDPYARVAEPVSIRVDTFGTGNYTESDLVKAVRKVFKTTPGGIIDQLDLRRPIYAKTATYGHFGRELPEFLWERKDKVDELKQVLAELTN